MPTQKELIANLHNHLYEVHGVVDHGTVKDPRIEASTLPEYRAIHKDVHKRERKER